MLQNPTAEERKYLGELNHFLKEEMGYQWIQGTKPQTLAFGLTDSPAGLAAWHLEKFRAWTDCDGNPENALSRDEMLANIALYWFTGAIGSAFWPYYARMHGPWPIGDGQTVDVPMGYTEFPKEILRPPRSVAEKTYTDIRRWSVMDEGRPLRGAGAARRAGARGDRVLRGDVGRNGEAYCAVDRCNTADAYCTLRHRQRLVLLEHAAAVVVGLDQLDAVAPQLGQVLQGALGLGLVEQHAVAHVVGEHQAAAAREVGVGDLQIGVLRRQRRSAVPGAAADRGSPARCGSPATSMVLSLASSSTANRRKSRISLGLRNCSTKLSSR